MVISNQSIRVRSCLCPLSSGRVYMERERERERERETEVTDGWGEGSDALSM